MKTIIYFLILLGLSSCVAGAWPEEKYISSKQYQEVIGALNDTSKKPVKYAMYPKGKEGINEHIRKKLKYPSEAYKQKITGRVVVRYVVGTDGYVKQIEVLQSAHPLLDNAAVEVIKSMDRWIPGYADSKPVDVQYAQPFNFDL